MFFARQKVTPHEKLRFSIKQARSSNKPIRKDTHTTMLPSITRLATSMQALCLESVNKHWQWKHSQ